MLLKALDASMSKTGYVTIQFEFGWSLSQTESAKSWNLFDELLVGNELFSNQSQTIQTSQTLLFRRTIKSKCYHFENDVNILLLPIRDNVFLLIFLFEKVK